MYDTSFLDDFSDDFTDAREKFLAAAKYAGGHIETFFHPSKGPKNELLATDVAIFGRLDANNIILVTSGVHGVEAWPGSACQIGWIRSGAAKLLPPEIAVIHVHAVNPWGMAWDCRQQEDNIDLNRHFVDFRSPPLNRAHAELHDAIFCHSTDPKTKEMADAKLTAAKQSLGRTAFDMALKGGQYTHPQGLYYGGTAPCWSHNMIDKLIDRHVGHAKRVVVCDFHSGYGPYGYGTPLWHMAGGDALNEAIQLFGATTQAPLADPDGDEFIQTGHIYQHWIDRLPNAAVVPMCFEFGGKKISEDASLALSRAWQIIRVSGDLQSPAANAIRTEMKACFAPNENEWREMVAMRGRQVLRQLIENMQ
jgi:Protein of unknown function (DUF2817)